MTAERIARKGQRRKKRNLTNLATLGKKQGNKLSLVLGEEIFCLVNSADLVRLD